MAKTILRSSKMGKRVAIDEECIQEDLDSTVRNIYLEHLEDALVIPQANKSEQIWITIKRRLEELE